MDGVIDRRARARSTRRRGARKSSRGVGHRERRRRAIVARRSPIDAKSWRSPSQSRSSSSRRERAALDAVTRIVDLEGRRTPEVMLTATSVREVADCHQQQRRCPATWKPAASTETCGILIDLVRQRILQQFLKLLRTMSIGTPSPRVVPSRSTYPLSLAPKVQRVDAAAECLLLDVEGDRRNNGARRRRARSDAQRKRCSMIDVDVRTNGTSHGAGAGPIECDPHAAFVVLEAATIMGTRDRIPGLQRTAEAGDANAVARDAVEPTDVDPVVGIRMRFDETQRIASPERRDERRDSTRRAAERGDEVRRRMPRGSIPRRADCARSGIHSIP